MSDRAMKILVVQETDDADLLAAASADAHALPPHAVERVNRSSEALDRLEEDDIDLVMLDIGRRGVDGLANVRDIRQRAPTVPIIVVTDERDDGLALAALRAGAQDCLVRAEMEAQRPLLARAVRFAVERGVYLNELDRNLRESARDRDVNGLQAIFATNTLTVTERSLGQATLRERHPALFRKLVHDYGQILDGLVVPSARQPSWRDAIATSTSINHIADQLGMLGAGPRDVVELHKCALAPRVDGRDGRAARRALAYLEEGKLLVLQLMGQLVLFYRSFWWGRKPVAKSPGGPVTPPATSPSGDQ